MLELVSDRGLACAPPSTPVQRQQTRVNIPDLSSLKSSMFHQLSNHSQKLDADRTMYLLVPGERRAYLVDQGDFPHYAANGYDANSSAGLLDRVQPESLS